MPEQTKQAILDLAYKGFMPLLMICAVLWGAYLVIDKLLDAASRDSDFIRNRLITEVVQQKEQISTVAKELNEANKRLDGIDNTLEALWKRYGPPIKEQHKYVQP